MARGMWSQQYHPNGSKILLSIGSSRSGMTMGVRPHLQRRQVQCIVNARRGSRTPSSEVLERPVARSTPSHVQPHQLHGARSDAQHTELLLRIEHHRTGRRCPNVQISGYIERFTEQIVPVFANDAADRAILDCHDESAGVAHSHVGSQQPATA